ncbi:hypothetical protein CVFO_0981 [Isorropodon fossajaponicum endosymbiont JTNG4]|uniref:hypothetical protein n=1 Tax=Isorropodon fossajaponicum symbiont TaxID=883811 RepID=UPI001915D162|nr:hypothetical protein [Isorropodon fossajaponicum symbiont]BBB24132.1 hypothetical protein CVFO_0981 [Isorropodon fossajaponicum endosymbiont JTNG4]
MNPVGDITQKEQISIKQERDKKQSNTIQKPIKRKNINYKKKQNEVVKVISNTFGKSVWRKNSVNSQHQYLNKIAELKGAKSTQDKIYNVKKDEENQKNLSEKIFKIKLNTKTLLNSGQSTKKII